MLQEVYFSMRYINNKAVRHVYNFYRRTGGGGHHWFVLPKDKVDLLIHGLAEAAMEYPNWAEFVKKRGKSSEELMNPSSVTELPREPEKFFEKLREYIEFDWRDNNGIIEIATHRPGKIIGRKGKNIRALRKHLNRDIKVVQAYYFARKLGIFNDGTITLYEYAPAWGKPDPKVIAKLPEEPYISKAFKVHLNKSYGFAVDSGWIAPWHISVDGEACK